MKIEPSHLKYFFEVAQRGGFTQASKTLRVSQPGISKIIRLIEDTYSVRLFDRHKRGASLTQEGQLLFESCQRAFAEFEEFENLLEASASDCEGPLSIGASDNLCNYVLPELLKKFLNNYPKVQPSIFSGTSRSIADALINREIDFGLFFTELAESSLLFQKINFVEFVIVASPSIKLSTGIIKELTYIGSRSSEYRRPYPTLQMLSSLKLVPKKIMEVNSQESQKQLALAGLGYTVLPKFMVETELKRKKLLALKTAKPIGSNLYLVLLKNRLLPKPAQILSEEIKASMFV